MVNKTRCEQCENCFSHVENEFCTKASKNCNKRHTPLLLTCAKCKEVRYCSRKCQKEQWKEHKSACMSHIGLVNASKLFGPRVEHAFKSFCKFSQTLSGHLEIPAISALELHKDKRRINTHVFFVKIRGKETIIYQKKNMTRGVLTFTIESAECKTMEEMHQFLDWRAGPFATPAITESTLAHRPGLLRMFVLEVSGMLPIPLDGYTLPTDISNWPANYHKRHDPNWFEALLASIGQPRRAPPVAPIERGVSSVFEDFNGPLIPPARPSSPVDD
ncbi:hypothetical protein BDN70DRAFT_879102 [Pholiota conissans]|uniref:MYND-type domain-containing protein n=1 Tax=Pholiota conissans TaxID=109636 RepID=A0A9P5Z1S7_9AGAR|nr:hypothetical protein BDN70DRAFT_879102 [Pholiota conissans]